MPTFGSHIDTTKMIPNTRKDKKPPETLKRGKKSFLKRLMTITDLCILNKQLDWKRRSERVTGDMAQPSSLINQNDSKQSCICELMCTEKGNLESSECV